MTIMIAPITIFSTGSPLEWTVVVGYYDTGEVVVSSGNKDSDWNIIVPATSVLLLKNTLINSGASSLETGNISSDSVDLLKQHFGARTKNPFDEIRKYLELHGISSKNSNWI